MLVVNILSKIKENVLPGQGSDSLSIINKLFITKYNGDVLTGIEELFSIKNKRTIYY